MSGSPVLRVLACAAAICVALAACGDGSSDPSSPSTPNATLKPPVETPIAAEVSATITLGAWVPAAGVLEVSGFVAGVLEQEGTCTLSVSMDTLTRTASGPASPNVADMQCGTLSIAGDALAPGSWTAVLSYSSASAKAVSEPLIIVVPA